MANASTTKGTATPIAIATPFEICEAAGAAVVVVGADDDVLAFVVEGMKSEALYRIWTG
jgi:hypothetical protein